MQLILVLVMYGIDLQNPHLTDAHFSWLHHIPNNMIMGIPALACSLQVHVQNTV